jgi:hypothetical protein
VISDVVLSPLVAAIMAATQSPSPNIAVNPFAPHPLTYDLRTVVFVKPGGIPIEIRWKNVPAQQWVRSHYTAGRKGDTYVNLLCDRFDGRRVAGCRIDAADPRDSSITHLALALAGRVSHPIGTPNWNAVKAVALSVRFSDGEMTSDGRLHCLPPFCQSEMAKPPAPSQPPPKG